MKNSYKNDNKRFKYLANIENQDYIANYIIQNRYKKVLDIGCFYGTLISNLRQKNWKGGYLGVDLDENVLNKAKTLNPNESFMLQNVLELNIQEKFDLTVIGGVFYYLEHHEALQVLDLIKNKISNDVFCHDVFRCRNKIYSQILEAKQVFNGDFHMTNAGHNSHRKCLLIKY